jgi:hypothetical protein
MLDYVAYLTAQRRTADRAREALPCAPVLPESPATRRELRSLRRGIGLAFYRLGDFVTPVPERRETATSHRG